MSEACPARKADIREPEGKSSWPLGQRRRPEPDHREAKASPVGQISAIVSLSLKKTTFQADKVSLKAQKLAS